MSRKSLSGVTLKQIARLTVLIGATQTFATAVDAISSITGRWYAGVFASVAFLVLGLLLVKAKKPKVQRELVLLLIAAVVVDTFIQMIWNSQQYAWLALGVHILLLVLYASALGALPAPKRTA